MYIYREQQSARGCVRFMVFNATFNNISFISGRSVLLVEETGVNREKPSTKSLTTRLCKKT